MITTSNLLETLQILGFVLQSSGVYQKSFGDLSGCIITVDFNAKKIIYPSDLKINDETTCNFAHPENFVVLECVNRLLDKGYRSEHIELEKRWNLGHDAKGGKADICVYDESGKEMLLIIECKTFGSEYTKEKKTLESDGGQLFSYWQQERHTKWLALYASDLKEDKVVYENSIINCSDDSNLILLAEKDDTIKLYKDAGTVEEKFEVWSETYGKDYCQDIIFGADTVAYQIGVKPLRKKDLRDFTPDDKIVNRFEEILRHNNVSDKENAFNRLVALFICKLVDEIGKDDDAELEFQYKKGIDTYEALQDRLQKLHQEGMEKFMREKIFYVSNTYAEEIVQQYSGQKRKAMIEELQKTIRILKFYTNNDFSFKDVHNEELFYQNGKVVVEVVQLFEKYRIVYKSKHQFLGDLFEQLLNKGFKQNEGQFFTPMPITRFIWDSLPLDNVISNAGKYTLPKIIDYACGAGHFLTEAVEAVNAALIRHNQTDLAENNGWVEKNIYGIEKDYRLARVSKISLFMNGAGYGNIIFGDGLDNYPEKQIEAGTFDILVANPPYSVKAFKAHFKPKNNSLELLDNITNDGSEIEVLFVERIAQLLKPEGVAAVILPSTLLQNTTPNSYIVARENILENFKIHAIVQLGGNTFGETNTNTVILFLKKYSEPPKRKELVADSVNAIQSGKDLTDWEDKEILRQYLAKIEVTEEDYRHLLSKSELLDYWKDHAYFGPFVKKFYASTEVKNKQKQQSFKKLSQDKQNEWLQEQFYNFVFEREQDKLKYFALIYKQKTLVVTAPANNDEQKEFLGYEWCGRKGAEGIRIQQPGGKLYNDADRTAENTVSANIRDAFAEQYKPSADLEKYLAWYRLQDMIDFSRVEFNKEIQTEVKITIQSKYSLVKLGEFIDILRGVTYNKSEQSVIPTDYIVLPADNISLSGNLNICKPIYLNTDTSLAKEKKLRKNDIFMCFSSGSKEHVGKLTYIDEDTNYYAGGFMGIIRSISEKLNAKYLFYFLNSKDGRTIVRAQSSGANINNLSNNIGLLSIPLPPIDIQQQIVAECEKVDAECVKAKSGISKANAEINQLIEQIHNDAKCPIQTVDEISTSVEYGSSAKSKKVGKVPVIRMGNIQDGKIDWSDLVYSDDEEEISKYLLKPNDVLFNRTNSPELVGKVGIYKGEQPAIFAGYLIRINYIPEMINPVYLCYILNSSKVRKHGFSVMSKSVNQANINGSLLKQYKIPVPTLDEQNAIVAKIEKFEQQIDAAQKILDSAFARKQAILDKYLQ